MTETNLRQKIKDAIDSGKFPYTDFYMFLSGVIVKRQIWKTTYDPQRLQIEFEKQTKLDDFSDQLLVDKDLGWDNDTVRDAITQYVHYFLDKKKPEDFLVRALEESAFKNLLAEDFKNYIYGQARSGEESITTRIRVRVEKILIRREQYICLSKEETKTNHKIWGLKTWAGREEIMSEYEIDDLLMKFPDYSHLRIRSKPNRTDYDENGENKKKASQEIIHNNLVRLVKDIFEHSNKNIRFSDIIRIVQVATSIYDHRMASFDELDEKAAEIEPELDDITFSKLESEITGFLNSLKPRDFQILSHIFDGLNPTKIHEKTGIPRTTVASIWERDLQPKIQNIASDCDLEAEMVFDAFKAEFEKKEL